MSESETAAAGGSSAFVADAVAAGGEEEDEEGDKTFDAVERMGKGAAKVRTKPRVFRRRRRHHRHHRLFHNYWM